MSDFLVTGTTSTQDSATASQKFAKKLALARKVSSDGSQRTPRTLVWRDICVTVPMFSGQKTDGNAKRRTILDNVSGLANPGETLAIMGGSGAGKTTLLNVIVNIDQKNIEKKGSILVNGKVLSNKEMRQISAYVQQVDVFIGTLKVREQLWYSAQLRMGRHYSKAERKARVEQVIKQLGLSNAQNTIIGISGRVKGISVGEKKRLAFACEILTDPMILFCDEPTSGLDSFMAQQVVSALSMLANSGKTIVTTIHQPSTNVFNMFDKVCFMAVGKAAYFGSPKYVIDFWKSVDSSLECPITFNPADHCIKTLSIVGKTSQNADESIVRITKIREAFENSYLGKELNRRTHEKDVDQENQNEGEPMQYAASAWVQFWVLLERSALTILRDPLLLKVRFIQVLLTAIFIGFVNWQTPITGPTIMNLEGIMFNSARDMNFMFLFPSITVITSELPIVIREHKSRIYSIEAYYLTKSLSELPQYTALALIYSLFIYFMAGFYLSAYNFFIFFLVNVLQTWVALSVAYVFACVFAEDALALTYVPVFALPMLVFGGFYINFRTIPTYFIWASYISWFHYGFESLEINQWTAIHAIPGCELDTHVFNATQAEVLNMDDYCPASNGVGILKRRGVESTKKFIWIDMAILLAEIIIFRTIGLIALIMRVRYTK